MDKVELYRRCKRIRLVEEAIADRYSENEMRCPTHLSIGQELVGAVAGMVLGSQDYAVSSHRAHAHYLGKGGNLEQMLAEIFGKETGCCKGRGGSMHLIDRSVGFEGSTAIVGNSIPVGVGLGYAAKLSASGRISCVFIGDAVFETGVFYESLNVAATKGLPVLFLCENNLYSVYSPLSVRQPVGRVNYQVADAMGVSSCSVDGMDAISTFKSIANQVDYVRSSGQPALVEISAYRWREHCGPNYDNHIGYRDEEEYLAWKERDYLERLENELQSSGELSASLIEQIASDVTLEVDSAFRFAKNSNFPDRASTGDFQYAGPSGQQF